MSLYFKAHSAKLLLKNNQNKQVDIITKGNKIYFSNGDKEISTEKLIEHLEIKGSYSFSVLVHIILEYFKYNGFKNVKENDDLMTIEEYLESL